MAIVPIYNCFHPVLRKPTTKVESMTDEIKSLINNLWDTLYNVSNGVGLAANQIGADKSVIVIDTSLNGTVEGSGPILLINPEITYFSEELIVDKEGCLSIPELFEDVVRSETIQIKYYDIEMNEHLDEAEGFLAIVMQHEVDHLVGKLFFDRFTPLKRALTKGKLNKIARGKFITAYDMIQADGSFTKGEPDEED
ncbi:MAG: peptide deformylase [bacterium]